MKRLAAILLSCLFATALFAQQSAVSRSEQFVIQGIAPNQLQPFVLEIMTNRTLVKLEPALLSVSCERIKQALLNALNVPDQWRGRIRIAIHPARAVNEEIEVAATRYADAWNYDVSLPSPIESSRLIRTITQVLLLELANRQLPPQSATLPTWLAEGMPQYLVAVSDVDFVLRPANSALRADELPSRVEQHEGRYLNPIAKARERLQKETPLTLRQLGDPEPGQLDGQEGEVYRDTALFLINELLTLKNGGPCLAAMLPELPWDPDWRVGFLKAFRQQFAREKDFEKWWALQSAYFAAHDQNQAWDRAASVGKLQEILRTPFEVRLGSNQPALYTDVDLTAIIKGWKLDRQLPVLKEKIKLLDELQLRVAPDVRPIAQQYRDVLQKYVSKQDTGTERTPESSGGRHPLAVIRPTQSRAPRENDAIVKRTLDQLATLDAHAVALMHARERAPEAKVRPIPTRSMERL